MARPPHTNFASSEGVYALSSTCAMISLWGSSFMLYCQLIFTKKSNPFSILISLLAFSNIMIAICQFLYNTFSFRHPCPPLYVVEFFLFLSVGYNCCIGYYLYHAAKNCTRSLSKITQIIMHTFCIALAVSHVLIFDFDSSPLNQTTIFIDCANTGNFYNYSEVIEILLAFAWCLTMVALILWIHKNNRLELPETLRLTLYLFAFILTWIFTIPAHFDENFGNNKVMIVVGNFFNNSQGGMDFLVYCLFQKPMWKRFSVTTGLLSFLLAPILLVFALSTKLYHLIKSLLNGETPITFQPQDEPTLLDDEVAQALNGSQKLDL
eukprot:TRINITY_DN7834_c0_g1_i1.p1 TRINITY_DN7834_c0_g1~~TRINITY_DN7834_c0_g1_i1.p1  ORF type:complete len:332 (+),score=30.09 TRINITY_DN7834_c0_g1_i1:32-997(+)